MNEIIDNGLAIIMLIGGIYWSLVGFNVIKFKAKTSEDEEKMKLWYKKINPFYKIGGIIVFLMGMLQLIIYNFIN